MALNEPHTVGGFSFASLSIQHTVNDETRRLRCLIEGESVVFTVTAGCDIDIGELKDIIKAYGIGKAINPATLELWKVDNIDLNTHNRDSLGLLKLGENDQGVEKLISWMSIREYWPDKPPVKHLNIIVKVPPNPSLLPRWLVEIHRKLWGRHDLFGQIFRTANLTKADFIELQRQLHEQNPDRNAESYVVKNIFATKSAFLRSKSTADVGVGFGDGLVPRLVFDASYGPSSDVADDADAVADDIMDTGSSSYINSDADYLSTGTTAVFPCTIQYMDLTVLDLENNIRVPQLTLLRNEWGSMIDIFNKRKRGMRGSAVFIGQPGIGKTSLLYSILILCIITAQPIVFQDVNRNVFIIDDTVHPSQATPAIPEGVNDVLSLVDAEGTSCEPNPYLFRSYKHRILLTSSPRARNYRRWLTQRVQDEGAVFMMEPWSREECLVASLFLQSTDITLKRFQEASRICGNIPRRCFEAAVSLDTLHDATRVIKAAIKQTTELSTVVLNVTSRDTIHPAFQVRPSEDRFWARCLIEPVSDWAFLQMMAELRRRSVDAAYKFYWDIQRCLSSSALGERMFETYLHPFLRTMQTPRTFNIESLDNRSATLQIHFTSNTNRLTFGAMEDFSGHLASSVKSNTPCYLQPLSPVFPSFTSFLYQPTISQSGFSPLIALQVTTSINIKGLEKVHESLELKVSELKDLQPTNARKMIILFVVPNTYGADFVKQTIKDAAKAGHWYKKTAQYILVLSEKEVFQVT